MNTPRIVPAVADHIPLLAPHIREADRVEVWASAHLAPEKVLRGSLAISSHAWTAFIGTKPMAMWGLTPVNVLTREAIPWLLSTTAVDEHPLAFLRLCRPVLALMRNVYPIMTNYVDDRYEAAKRWLLWLGFKLGEPEPWGVERLPFRSFELRD